MNEFLASARNEFCSNLNVNVITGIIMMALTAMTAVTMIDSFVFGAAVTERIYSLSARYLPVITTFDSGPGLYHYDEMRIDIGFSSRRNYK